MQKIKLYINKEDDGLAVASILVKNGYTVKIDREKKNQTAKSYVYFVRAEKEEGM